MKMIHLISTLSLLFCMACSGDDSEDVIDIKCEPNEIVLEATDAQKNFRVDCNAEWELLSNDSWLAPQKDGRAETNGVVVAENNLTINERKGSFVIKAGNSRLIVPVTQKGKEVPAYPAPEGYTLVWHDEFDQGNRLGQDWTHEVQSSGWVNNELQNYVDGEFEGKRVTELVGGSLNIHCFKASNGKIYSGRVYAHVNKGWKYGYIEARILLPKGKGTWPAFWMMPVNVDWNKEPWPKCGEIDIMEEVGCVPNEVSSSLHAEGHNHTNGTQVTKAMTIDKAEGEYHVYAMEWTKEGITTYVDGKKLLEYASDGTVRNYPYDKPYYIILNLAWGGAWGGMNGVDESALPITMKVDYVRVFQKK